MKKDKDLEELEKTTDLLRAFKSRIEYEEKTEDLDSLMREWKNSKTLEKEEKKEKKIEKEKITNNASESKEFESSPLSRKAKQARKNLEYVDDRTLELSDLELDKTIRLDATMSLKDLTSEDAKKMFEESKFNKQPDEDEVKIKLEEDLKKNLKYKRRAFKLFLIGIFFVPLFLTMHIIHTHSNLLINDKLDSILILLLGICFGLCTVSGITFYRYRKLINDKSYKTFGTFVYACIFIVYSMVLFTGLFLLYGPSKDFKDWLVTTSMSTKDHQYYCKWFYSDKEIKEVYKRNYIKEPNESTDESLIDTNKDKDSASNLNKYEEQILKKDNENDLYKIITFDVNGCKAYLAVIYDPSKVRVTTTSYVGTRGQYVVDMAKRENSAVAINGSGFYDPNWSSTGGCPKGITIVNGKIVTNNEYGAVTTGGIIGMTKDNKLVLLKNTTAQQALQKGVRDAVSWGPFLIVNGKAAYTSGNGGWGYAARTAIGQRADGIVLLLVVDSNYNRTKGADMVNLTQIMQNYGAINAANLDGGTSSVMVVNGSMISHPVDSALNPETRPIATSIIVDK